MRQQAEIYTTDGKLIRIIEADRLMPGDTLMGMQTLVSLEGKTVASLPINCLVILTELGRGVQIPVPPEPPADRVYQGLAQVRPLPTK